MGGAGVGTRNCATEGHVCGGTRCEVMLMYLFATAGQRPPSAMGTSIPPDSEDGEQDSPYGTGESDPEPATFMEEHHEAGILLEGLSDMKRLFVAVTASQSLMVEKLAALEKLVSCVQEDLTWVRGDVRVMHEVLEKLSDQVSLQTNTVAMVEGVPPQRSPEFSAWGPWDAEAPGKEWERTSKRRSADNDIGNVDEHHRSDSHVGHQVDTAIQETQLYDLNTFMHTDITSLAEDGEPGGWVPAGESGPEMTPPREEQTAGEVGDDILAASTQIEMTIDETQSGTLAPGQSLMAQFVSTVREMKGAASGADNTSGGWVQSKRGRSISSVFGGSDSVQSLLQPGKEHNSFNLNMSPEKVDTVCVAGGRGQNAARGGRGTTSRGGGRAGGRGAGRGKKLPLVSPRYFTTASFWSTLHIYFCLVVFAFYSKND